MQETTFICYYNYERSEQYILLHDCSKGVDWDTEWLCGITFLNTDIKTFTE